MGQGSSGTPPGWTLFAPERTPREEAGLAATGAASAVPGLRWSVSGAKLAWTVRYCVRLGTCQASGCRAAAEGGPFMFIVAPSSEVSAAIRSARLWEKYLSLRRSSTSTYLDTELAFQWNQALSKSRGPEVSSKWGQVALIGYPTNSVCCIFLAWSLFDGFSLFSPLNGLPVGAPLPGRPISGGAGRDSVHGTVIGTI
ncbi:hypothetical protein CCHR01_14283 [Colletotrichum chrysophilum]|uniref:Uncharacterized protein n=1 Tax=Colletotrichum chrysophilum TaxID=1836956 RepID=A0AAD9A7U4_9PEZI|nr:hypothetical protein CCHR01_14283 [Colletotrichum chrysophilum]